MVVTVVWMESLTVVIISSCVLLVIGALLVCCVCWDTKRNSLRHFYMLDENGLRKVTPSKLANADDYEKGKGLFRHISTGSFKTNLNFLNNDFPSKVLCASEKRKRSSRSDLTQSMEIADAFDNSVLCLEGTTGGNGELNSAARPDKEDDVCSCISSDSRHTFYSTYPWARTMSVADTIRSALSQPELNNCAN